MRRGGENSELELVREKHGLEVTDPHIFMNVLERVLWCYTLTVTRRVVRLPIFIPEESGSIHNFMNTWVANKLQYKLTPINLVMVKGASGGKYCALQSINISGGRCREYISWPMFL